MTGTPCFNIVKARLRFIFDSLHAQLRNCLQIENIADLLLAQVDPLTLGKLKATVAHYYGVIIITLYSVYITPMSMVSHRGHNCISSALTILDSALTS